MSVRDEVFLNRWMDNPNIDVDWGVSPNTYLGITTQHLPPPYTAPEPTPFYSQSVQAASQANSSPQEFGPIVRPGTTAYYETLRFQ